MSEERITELLAEIAELEKQSVSNELAVAYRKLGYEYYQLKTASAFQQALACWEQAIQVGEQLPKDNPKYQHGLASVYTNRGTVQSDLRQLEAALASYNHAIAIREQLSKDNPEYQNNLASAYYNRGIVQSDLRQLDAALASYNQAIAIREQLPKDNPEYQNDLASAYYNRGIVQSDLRQLDAALASYNQAIAIREQLLKDNPEYQNDLASVYNSRGAVQSDLHQLDAALTSYNHAIAIREQLPKDNPEYQNDLARAYNNKGALYINDLGDAETANEWFEKALDILRDLEIQEIFWYRTTRERYFENTIITYIACCPRFLPEFLLEHLDPKNAGAAPQSDAMHQAALHGLHDLYLSILKTDTELVTEIQTTLVKLIQIRNLYLVGSVQGIALTAQFYEEHVQNFVKAEAILRTYTEKQPADPLGYFQLADFYLRRKNTEAAQEYYLKAGLVLVETAPDSACHSQLDWESMDSVLQRNDDFETSLDSSPSSTKNEQGWSETDEALYHLLDFMLTQQFLADGFKYSRQVGAVQVGTVVVHYIEDCRQRAEHWLDKLPQTLQQETVLETLKQALLQFNRDWAEQTTSTEKFKVWQAQQNASLSAKQQHARHLLENLPLTWQQYNQKVQYTLSEAEQWIKDHAAELGETEAKEKMRGVLEERMSVLYRQRHAGEYNPELFKSLEKARYLQLSKTEHQYLTIALQHVDSVKKGDSCFFEDIGINLGKAVEARLLSLFRQLCKRVALLPKTSEVKYPFSDLIKYCQGKGKLPLGKRVGILEQTIFNKKPIPINTFEEEVMVFFQTQIPALSDQDSATKGERIGRLNKIVEIRNKCSHAKEELEEEEEEYSDEPVSQEDIKNMLTHVLKHKEHAFFRYFPKI